MSDPAATKCLDFHFTSHPSASPFKASKQRYLDVHPSASYTLIATGALVFDNSDPETPRILLIQRSASDSMPNQWEFPGGGCDDEDPSILYAVARELWEEAGLRAKCIDALVGEPQLFSTRSGKEVCKFNFVVQAETNAQGKLEVKLDPNEHQRFIWASEAEVRAKKVQGGMELDFTTQELVSFILQAFDRFKLN